MCAAKSRMDAHPGCKSILVKALHAVPADSLQVQWLKQNHDIHEMLWQTRQTILQLPRASQPDVCALWAKLLWLDWLLCKPDKGSKSVASSAPGSMLWTAAEQAGYCSLMLAFGCTMVGAAHMLMLSVHILAQNG